MDMDQTAVFLSGAILTCLGFVVISLAILVVNNLYSKYWRPITFYRYEYPPRFVEEPSMQPVDKTNEPPLK